MGLVILRVKMLLSVYAHFVVVGLAIRNSKSTHPRDQVTKRSVVQKIWDIIFEKMYFLSMYSSDWNQKNISGYSEFDQRSRSNQFVHAGGPRRWGNIELRQYRAEGTWLWLRKNQTEEHGAGKALYGVVPEGLFTFLGSLYKVVTKTTSETLVYHFERQTARKFLFF